MQGDLRGTAAGEGRGRLRRREGPLSSTTPSPLALQYRVATVGILTTVTLVAFESYAVATAMPLVARDLGGLRYYGLAFSLFLTTALVGIVLAGAWCDARGPRWPVLVGLAAFALGLLACGGATTFALLLVGRAVSGFGGGLLTVSLYVVIAGVFPTQAQPQLFGYLSAAWVLPSVLGPPVAGWLAETVSWRVVFLGVAPLAVVLGLLLAPRLPPRPVTDAGPPQGAGVRVLAGLAVAGGAFGVQYGLQGAGSWPGGVVTAAGVAAIAAGIGRLLPPGTLRLARGLPSVVLARGFYAGTFFAAETFVPLMLVEQRGLSAGLAGLSLTGGAVGWAAGSWIQGRPGLRTERTTLLRAGIALVALAVLALVPSPLPALPDAYVWGVWIVGGLGMGLGLSSTSVLTLRLSAPGEEGRNSSALQVCDSLGAVLTLGAVGALFGRLHDPGGDGSVYSLLWSGLVGLALVGLVVAWRARPNTSGGPVHGPDAR